MISMESTILLKGIDRDFLCALLSSNLYFWFYHIYSNCKDLKKHSKIKKVNYSITKSYREFYSRYSKYLIDQIDHLIKELYCLTNEEL